MAKNILTEFHQGNIYRGNIFILLIIIVLRWLARFLLKDTFGNPRHFATEAIKVATEEELIAKEVIGDLSATRGECPLIVKGAEQ